LVVRAACNVRSRVRQLLLLLLLSKPQTAALST
jgi:hypothetical protein